MNKIERKAEISKAVRKAFYDGKGSKKYAFEKLIEYVVDLEEQHECMIDRVVKLEDRPIHGLIT